MANIQEYDEASIELCGNFAEEFFNDFNKYKDQYKPDVLFSSISIEIMERRNALDNYILKYYSKLDDKNPVDASIKRNMDRYLQTLYKRFVSKPNELLGSPFLKSSQIINIYCPEKIQIKGNDIDLRKKVNETYRENTKNPKELYVRDRNLDDLSKEDNDRLMHMLISEIGTDDKQMQGYQEGYLKKLIQQKSRVSELNPKQVEFVAKYINNLMLNSRLKQLGYSREDIQSHIYIGEDRKELGGFENGNSIYINKNSVLTTDIPSLIQVVCHETEHSIQEFEATRNPKSKIGLDLAISNVLRNYYFSEKRYDVYHNNYRFEQIEQDAEYIGYTQAIIYLDMLGFKDEAKKLSDVKTKKSDSRRFEYDYRTDENGKKCTREEFFFNSLNNAIAKRPNMVSQYPALSLLYTQDGKVKSFEDIITSDFKVNDQSKSDILEDFCKYYISKGALDNLDLSKFSEEIQANVASRLITILGKENLQIGIMGQEKQQYYYKDVDENDKKGVEIFHLKNSRNIMRFMNKNYQHFMELQDKGKFSSIINMDYYDSNARSFKYDSKYENLAYNNKNHIEEIKQLAIEAEEQKNIYRSNKKQKFTPNALETSFDILVGSAKLSEFQQATQGIKTLSNETILQNVQKMEEK